MQLCRSPSVCCCAQQALQAHCRVFRSLHLSRHSSTACSGNPTLADYVYQPLSGLSFAQFCFVATTGTCFAYMDQRSVPGALPERSKSCSGSHVLAVQAAIHHQKSDHRAEGQSSGCKALQETAEQKKTRQQDSAEQWSQAAAWSASQSPCQSQAADCEAPGVLLLRTMPSAIVRPCLLSAIAMFVARVYIKYSRDWLGCLTQSSNKSKSHLLSLGLIKGVSRQTTRTSVYTKHLMFKAFNNLVPQAIAVAML